MKIMDVSTQDDNPASDVVTPPKQKKMKQARLPFQILSSLDSPHNVSNKKRKLTSPSVDCKSPKIVRFDKEENIAKDVVKSMDTDNLNKSESEIETLSDTDVQEEEKQKDINGSNVTPKRHSIGKGKKGESKNVIKHGGLTKFLKTPDEIKKSNAKTENHAIVVESDEDGKAPSKSKDSEAPAKVGDVSIAEEDTSKDSKNISWTNTSELINLSSDTESSSDSEDNEEQEKSDKAETDSKSDSKQKSLLTPESDKNKDLKRRKLTPKQLEKRLESAKKREQKEQMKMEKQRRRQEEREARRKLKEEKRKEKEEKEKAEKEQKRKDKEMKELKKQMEIEQKQKEKEAKEGEKRKKEEEKLEAERKKQKEASNFASFFVAKKSELKSAEEKPSNEQKNFMPFEVKADMRITPLCRRVLDEKEKRILDEKMKSGDTPKAHLYLGEIAGKKIIPRKSWKTWPLEAKDDIVLIEEEDENSANVVDETSNLVEKQRPKLLQFAENRRPPYWGTWRKNSGNICARRPFAKDSRWFDYEIDSDEEWEEEEPGESLRGSDDEKDEENPEDNEYDVDNEFMVPHGYLSDEEARADEEDGENMSPETQKFKLKILGEEFEAERNTKTAKLKPKIIGCVWQGKENTFPENLPRQTREFLSGRCAWVRGIPVTLPSSTESSSATDVGTSTPTGSKRTRVPDEALADLVRLIHGNTHGKAFLVKEFASYWRGEGRGHLSKASLSEKIRELGKWTSCPDDGPMHRKACWYVPVETRERILGEAVDEVTLPNRWSYVLEPRKPTGDVADERQEREEVDKAKIERRNASLITQFTKKITQEEMKRQLTTIGNATKSVVVVGGGQQKTPKRATLISVARGEQFSKNSRDKLLGELGDKDEVAVLKVTRCDDGEKREKVGETSQDGGQDVEVKEDEDVVILDKDSPATSSAGSQEDKASKKTDANVTGKKISATASEGTASDPPDNKTLEKDAKRSKDSNPPKAKSSTKSPRTTKKRAQDIATRNERDEKEATSMDVDECDK